MTKPKTTPAAAPELTVDQIKAERARLGIPESGQELRSWLRYKLQNVTHPKTKKPWTQADIARKAKSKESSVSVVYRGARPTGQDAERIRLVTAEVLGIPAQVLFPKPSTN